MITREDGLQAECMTGKLPAREVRVVKAREKESGRDAEGIIARQPGAEGNAESGEIPVSPARHSGAAGTLFSVSALRIKQHPQDSQEKTNRSWKDRRDARLMQRSLRD